MKSTTIFSLLIFTSLTLLSSTSSLPHHRPPPLITTLTTTQPPHQQPPTVYFEVTKPTPPTPTTTPCSHHLLSHDFASTYSHPPVTTLYSPPSHCPFHRLSTVILDFSATCYGRQYDRIFGIWLNGVELLRSCTAEPRLNGVFWNVRKDISKYSSLLQNSNLTLSIYLGNIIDKTHTGIYHVNLTFHYYPLPGSGSVPGWANGYADLVLPISENLPLNHGLWFVIENSTDFHYKEVVIPRNVYRAVLEVYVSFHENDEFWYSNLPSDYLKANNMTETTPGNGPFREVVVTVDGELVGVVWPFTVVYTGGVNPLLWRPITAIGSFDLPSYDIEITPFLGKLLDGKPHHVEFSVTNSLNVWYVDANLHLWLDNSLEVLKAELLENIAEPLSLSSGSDFKGLNGKFHTGAKRSIVSRGWVESSKGNVTTISIQNLDFKNVIVVRHGGAVQTVNQTIEFNTSVSSSTPSSSPFRVIESHKEFSLFLYTDEIDLGNNSYRQFSNVTLGFDENKALSGKSGVASSILRNHQKGEGNMLVKDNLVTGGLGSMHQVYDYSEKNGADCYFRNVSSYNYTIRYDYVKDTCETGSPGFRSLINQNFILL